MDDIFNLYSLFQKRLNDTCNHLCTYVSHLNMVISIFEYKQSSSWLPGSSLPSVATTNKIHSSIKLCSAKFHLRVRSIQIYTFYLYTMIKSTVPIHQPTMWVRVFWCVKNVSKMLLEGLHKVFVKFILTI